jgi:lipopolysaccharide export system ATP-binding protein
MSLLRALNLAKSYKSRQVLRDLSLQVASGEIVGLLGPNGAGKTTAFYMIVGLTRCERGAIMLDGRDISRLPMHRRAQLGLGYLPQEPSVFRKLSVEDNIMAILETRPKLGGAARKARLEELLEELHIGHVRESLGMSRRRATARRDRARAGRGSALHSAGRAICGRRPPVGRRYPAHNQALVVEGDRRADNGS